MKALLTEIRLYLSELLLGLIISLAPAGPEGEFLIITVLNYFNAKVKNHKK